MNFSPSNNKRNFKPTKISDSLKNVNEKFLYKFGKLDYTIHAKWGEIVGYFFVQHSQPLKISTTNLFEKDKEPRIENFLHVNVTPSIAVEFQHFQNKIIEKINSYFGYKAIQGIKIHQKLVTNHNLKGKKIITKYSQINKNDEEIKNTTKKIKNKDLKKSVLDLGMSIKNSK